MIIKKYQLAIWFLIGFSPLLFFLFWLMPLINLDALMASSQTDGNYTDANFYLYHAQQNCLKPIDSHIYMVTWSSFGVVSYLSLLCYFTGSIYAFIFSNLLIFCISYLFYLKKISNYYNGLPGNILLFSFLFMPYTILLILSPGKELFGISSILLICSTFFMTNNVSKLLIIFIAIFFAGFSRFHQAGAIGLIYLIIIFLQQRFILKILLLFMIMFCLDIFLNTYLGLSYRDLYFDGSGKRSGFALTIGKIFYNDNIIIHAAMAPLRICLLLFGPIYQSIFSVSNIDNFNYWIFRDLQLRLRLIDTLVIIFGLIFIFNVLKDSASRKIGLFAILYLFMISFFGVIEKNKYIYELTPILLPMLSLGFYTFYNAYIGSSKD